MNMSNTTSVYEKLVNKKFSLSSNELTLEMVTEFNNGNSVSFVFGFDVYDIIDENGGLYLLLSKIYTTLPELINKYFNKYPHLQFHVYNLMDLDKDQEIYNDINNSLYKLENFAKERYDSSIILKLDWIKFEQPEGTNWWPDCILNLKVLTNNDTSNGLFLNHYRSDLLDVLYDNQATIFSVSSWCEIKFELDISHYDN